MKTLILIVAVIFTTSAHAADNAPIYGWDILCKGANGFVVRATQSDDDFYANFKSKTIEPLKIWMDSMSQGNSKLMNLTFVTDPEYSNRHTASLSIARTSTANNQFATGVMTIEGERHELKCFVRFAEYEDDFDLIINHPFPKF
jgi:hypothetical protein